jgi:AmmeMemoRadiSam system protein B/AmmeMemoRadiSam system protein A
MMTTFLGMQAFAEIREPAVAGRFYPSDPTELKMMVAEHLSGVPSDQGIDGELVALIVPHAGLIYSGKIAAYAYKLLENSGIRKVVLCGPSHHYRFQGLSVYGPGVLWKTPLGMVSCDDTLCNQLLKYNKNIAKISEAHSREHCLEVQLPYLISVLKEFGLVPVIMGNPDETNIELLASALTALKSEAGTVMIASTDWQHYRPAEQGRKMDSLGMECLLDLDAERLSRYLNEGKVEMCGGGAAVAVMKAAMARGANRIKILKYGDSGDISGDKSSVVGYAAAALYKSNDKKPSEPRQSQNTVRNDEDLIKKYNLNTANKKTLLRIARESIVSYLNKGQIPDFDVSEDLQEFGAAFVTLEENGMLRGCIGHTTAEEPLYKTVSYCAVQAATSDPRFPPVRTDETEALHIEISVLGPMKKISSPSEIEVGRDGLMIFMGSRRGLLLPQVAVDYGWNSIEFLEQTCVKAGLERDAYKNPQAIIYRFQAVVFGE